MLKRILDDKHMHVAGAIKHFNISPRSWVCTIRSTCCIVQSLPENRKIFLDLHTYWNNFPYLADLGSLKISCQTANRDLCESFTPKSLFLKKSSGSPDWAFRSRLRNWSMLRQERTSRSVLSHSASRPAGSQLICSRFETCCEIFLGGFQLSGEVRFANSYVCTYHR